MAGVAVMLLALSSMREYFEPEKNNRGVVRLDWLEPQIACARTVTYCTCKEKAYRSLVLLNSTYEGHDDDDQLMCKLDEERDGFECACPGTALCRVNVQEHCNSRYRLLSDIQPDETAECEPDKRRCERLSLQQTCSEFAEIFIDGQHRGCVGGVPVVSDIDYAYLLNNGRPNRIENLLHDYANLRLVERTSTNDMFMCVIYSNWFIGEQKYPHDDGTHSTRRYKSRVSAGFPLYFVLKDDPSDGYSGEGTSILHTNHKMSAAESDGFCFGPVLVDGSATRIELYGLNSSLGVNVQSYNATTKTIENSVTWHFSDHVLGAELYSDGRTDGDEAVVIDLLPSCTCDTAQAVYGQVYEHQSLALTETNS